MLSLLEEIIIEILAKLPARELCRLRCVSKSWCKLIDSPFFVKIHLNHSIQNNSNKTVVLSNNKELFYICIDDLLDQNSIIKDVNARPLKSGPNSKVFGSCNGLLLLCKGDDTCRQEGYSRKICSGRCMKDFGIWNPTTGEYKSLPAPLALPKDGIECKAFYDDAEHWVKQRYGFGYDSMRDDYIVVKLDQMYVWSEKISTQVDIYSMKLNSWRRIECVSLPLSIQLIQTCAVFASGHLHWATEDENQSELSILAFDIGTEEFRFVAKPDNLPKVLRERKNNSITMRVLYKLHELKGNLYLSYISDKSSDIWIMRDYGVKESWIKLLSIPLSPCSRNHKLPFVDHPANRPLAYSSLGDKILLNERFGGLILHDTRGGMKKEDLHLGELGPLYVGYSCVDSLVRLSSSQEENDAKRKRRRISFG